jgi:hypothetical protein
VRISTSADATRTHSVTGKSRTPTQAVAAHNASAVTRRRSRRTAPATAGCPPTPVEGAASCQPLADDLDDGGAGVAIMVPIARVVPSGDESVEEREQCGVESFGLFERAEMTGPGDDL